MLRLGETKVAKEIFYGPKQPWNIWDVNVDNIKILPILFYYNELKQIIILSIWLDIYMKS